MDKSDLSTLTNAQKICPLLTRMGAGPHKVTRQYASGSEAFFAEFNDLDDATMFIGKILATDEKSSVKQTCRLFDNNALLQNFNPNDVDIKNVRAQYADGDCELRSSIADPFNFIVRVTLNSELVLAKFSNLKDAKYFVNAKLLADSNTNVDLTYYIFDLVQTMEKKGYIKHRQSIFINKYIQSPLSFGLPKAKIYFPLDAEIKWTAREIQMILAHENVHVERNDSLWKLLSLIVQAVLFFEPWMYYLHRRFELEMEVFCDLKTCKKTGADIQEYGNFLLAMTCAQPQNLFFTNMTDSTLKRRLLAMKSKIVNSGFLVFILSLVILLGGSTAIGMTSGIKEKNFFIIKTKIIVDGKLVSSPEILAKENQKASITINNNTDNSGDHGLRMQLMAKKHRKK